MIAGFVCWRISFKLSNAVFSDDAFHDIIWVLLLLFWVMFGIGQGGICGSGGRWLYLFKDSKILNVSFKRLFGR